MSDPHFLGRLRSLAIEQLCRETENALAERRIQHAQRLIERAADIDPSDQRVLLLSARCAMQQDQPRRVADLLDAQPHLEHQTRLLRLLAWMRIGRLDEAHLELSQWQHEPKCPPLAQVLLAWLDAEAGHATSSHRLLERDDLLGYLSQAAQLRLALSYQEDMADLTEHVASVLVHRFSWRPTAAAMIRSFDLLDGSTLNAVPIRMIDQLAGELLSRPAIIPSLVAVQQLQPQPGRIELLRRALTRIVDQVDSPLPVIVAQAQLAELAGDNDDAIRHARRGLAIDPYQSHLAMLYERASRFENNVHGRDALAVLSRLARIHEDYQDVQRALILGYQRQGMIQTARRLAERWLKRSNHCPLAEKTCREVAA